MERTVYLHIEDANENVKIEKHTLSKDSEQELQIRQQGWPEVLHHKTHGWFSLCSYDNVEATYAETTGMRLN